MKVKLVVATKESEEKFYTDTPTGISLRNLGTPVTLRLFANNTQGLSTVYNSVIKECIDDNSLIIFLHDDVTITDYYWVSRILEGLQHFDVVGIAGNKRIVPFSPGWSFIDTTFKYEDNQYLSGAWGHGHTYPPEMIFDVGPPRQQVKLLDGLLLACYSDVLLKGQVYFDETFAFHYYDLDFCRTANQHNLKLGTIDLFVIHGKKNPSLGYNDPECIEMYKLYIKKWGS